MCVCVCVWVAQSCPTVCDPMDIAHQAPPSMGFSRQEYWSGLPCPPPGGQQTLAKNIIAHIAGWMRTILGKVFQPPCFWVKVDILNILVQAHAQSLGRLGFFATQWTVACQAPLFMGFPRQEYWTGLPFLSLGDLPNPGIEPVSPAWAGGFFTTELPGKPIILVDRANCSPESLHSFIPSPGLPWWYSG